MLHAISLELAGHYKAELPCQLLRAATNEALRYLSGVVHAVQPVPVTVLGNPNVKRVGQKTEAPSIDKSDI